MFCLSLNYFVIVFLWVCVIPAEELLFYPPTCQIHSLCQNITPKLHANLTEWEISGQLTLFRIPFFIIFNFEYSVQMIFHSFGVNATYGS